MKCFGILAFQIFGIFHYCFFKFRRWSKHCGIKRISEFPKYWFLESLEIVEFWIWNNLIFLAHTCYRQNQHHVRLFYKDIRNQWTTKAGEVRVNSVFQYCCYKLSRRPKIQHENSRRQGLRIVLVSSCFYVDWRIPQFSVFFGIPNFLECLEFHEFPNSGILQFISSAFKCFRNQSIICVCSTQTYAINEQRRPVR